MFHLEGKIGQHPGGSTVITNGGLPGLVLLQKLQGDGGCDNGRGLAAQAANADRTGERTDLRWRKPGGCQPVAKARPLARRADETDKCKIRPRQRPVHDMHVKRVVMRHDDNEAARRNRRNCRVDIAQPAANRMFRNMTWKRSVAPVHPAHVKRQRRQRQNQCPPDMPGPEHRHLTMPCAR